MDEVDDAGRWTGLDWIGLDGTGWEGGGTNHITNHGPRCPVTASNFQKQRCCECAMHAEQQSAVPSKYMDGKTKNKNTTRWGAAPNGGHGSPTSNHPSARPARRGQARQQAADGSTTSQHLIRRQQSSPATSIEHALSSVQPPFRIDMDSR